MELKDDYFINISTKRKIAFRNAILMEMIADKISYKADRDSLKIRAKRIKECLNYWEWAKYDLNKVLDLRKVSRCKDRYCPNCRAFQLGKIIIKLTPKIEKLIKIEESHPYLLTLTIPNCKSDDLGETIKKLTSSFRIFWNWIYKDKKGYSNKLFEVLAGFRVIEITFNYNNGTWHPHIHAVLFLKHDSPLDFNKKYKDLYQNKTERFIYKSDADYLIQKLWTLAYTGKPLDSIRLLQEEDILMCDIRNMVLPSGLYEVFKYCFKDNDVINGDNFGVIFNALHRVRLKQSYGDLYGIVNDNDDDDVINGDDDFMETWIKIQEEFSIYRSNNVLEAVNKFKDYKKISRFTKDKEYLNIQYE